MKILYAGVYREFGGWATATQNNILALDAAGIDVVCRPIIFSSRHNPSLPTRILELESRPATGADIIIQHILPHFMEYSGYFDRNIGVYYSETSHFRASNWPERLNLMDDLWVCSNQMKEAAIASYVKKPIHVLPCSTDISRFQRSYKPLDIRPQRNSFLFYSVGTTIYRKNLETLLKAFHTEFEPYEPVELVIKVASEKRDYRKKFLHFCAQVKDSIKLKKTRYKNEIIITDDLSEEAMMRLHYTCDCYVNTSRGEAWSLPTFDAMGMGKTPIAPNWGGFLEYLNNDCGWLVPVREVPANGGNESLDVIYTGKEDWAEMDIRALCSAMREAYTNSNLRQQKAATGTDRAYEFDYYTVGNKMKRMLEYEPTSKTFNNRTTGN